MCGFEWDCETVSKPLRTRFLEFRDAFCTKVGLEGCAEARNGGCRGAASRRTAAAGPMGDPMRVRRQEAFGHPNSFGADRSLRIGFL